MVTGTPNNRRVAGSYGRLKCSIAVWLELVDLALGRAGVGGDFDLRLAEFTVDVAARHRLAAARTSSSTSRSAFAMPSAILPVVGRMST